MSTSSRPKRARTTKSYKETESSDEQGDDYQPDGDAVEEDPFEPGPSTPKKRKTTASGKNKSLAKSSPKQPRRKKEGSLMHVLHLPQEIQDEILSYLSPEILILLLRVKPIRERLTGPGANHIWKSVRINAGMPELQAKDISERQYLTLVFDKHCHDCGTPGVRSDNLDLLACTRLCGDCRLNWKLYDRRKYQSMIKKYHPEAENCAKSSESGGVPLPRGIKKISEKLRRMSPQEVKKFITERQVLKEQIAADAEAIREWFKERDREKDEKSVVTQEMRRQQIHEKLLEEGWTDETLPEGWDSEKQVTYSTNLTTASWNRIQKDLQESLRRKILDQRRGDRAEAVKEAYLALLQARDDPLFPSFKKFRGFLSIESLLDIPQVERPELEPFVEFDQAKWDEALVSAEPLVAEYEQTMRELAIKRLKDAYNARGLPVPDDPISAPRSFFRYFQGTPPGDWGDIPEQVAKFPEIHAIMRDRQTGKKVFELAREYRAAEFERVRKKDDRRGMGYMSDERLDVDLDYEEKEGKPSAGS